MIAEAIIPRVTLGSTQMPEVTAPGRGEPTQVQGEREDQQESEPEARHRHAEQGHDHRARVEPGVAQERRHEPERHADRDRHRHTRQCELRRAPDVLADLGGHGAPAPDRGAEITANRVGDEASVLLDDRLVQVQLRPHLLDLGRRRDELGEHHLHGVAGDQEQHAEHGEGDPEQHGDHREQSPGEVRQHAGAELTPYRRMVTSLRTGYALKLYFAPCTLARNAHTERSSSSGTVSASSIASFSIAR